MEKIKTSIKIVKDHQYNYEDISNISSKLNGKIIIHGSSVLIGEEMIILSTPPHNAVATFLFTDYDDIKGNIYTCVYLDIRFKQ